MKSNNIIEVSKLYKRFNGIQAVDGIDFHVKQGELFGFLGPNGAGKTTIMRMLTGIIAPDKGKISVLGLDISKYKLEVKKAMGIVPELSNAYIDMTAWENLMFIGALYDINKNERQTQANELLKKFDLYKRKDHKVKGFSKGMQKKLLICMALISNPRILFLDEPTSGLDVESQRLIKDLILAYNQSGVTVFLTTHNL
ncbi:MAG: ABC transporter ATP-binding protein, partial [Promethearchaeota archaeon]